jgi:hypothetical protein
LISYFDYLAFSGTAESNAEHTIQGKCHPEEIAMADGEQEWIAKYRAALDANLAKEPRSMHAFVVSIAKSMIRRFRRVHDSLSERVVVKVQLSKAPANNQGSLSSQRLHTIEGSGKSAAAESLPLIIQKAG